MNFHIASGEETDSIFEQAALGHKFEDPEVSISSSDHSDAYGDEFEDSADENGQQEESVPIDYSLKP